MSGTVGIFNRDGGPMEPKVLWAMTDFLAYRGPDARDVWFDGSIGLGHTLLRTTEDRNERPQPKQFKALSITADVRLDARDDLRRTLKGAGRPTEPGISDAMLILHAYAAWGTACVEYLRGDFSFGLWDSATKTLFCARDHFGIKPFYYATLGNLFLFSNTLDCLRRHPAVTTALNESAIGDFLLFGLNYDKSTTTFQDIQRLAPAHKLSVSQADLKVSSYWQLPTDDRVRYGRTEDYLERFNELLRSAVSDRLPSDRVGILLSGGLDSGAVAAVAKEISGGSGGMPEICSYTIGYDSPISDDEGIYASKLAKSLDIPNQYLRLDHLELFGKGDNAKYQFPEPVDNPLSAGVFEQYQMIAADCRVVLSGEGPDNLMYFQMSPYIKDLRRKGQWSRLCTETARFLYVRPFPWRGIAARFRAPFARGNRNRGVPSWIAPAFAKRAGLEARWRHRNSLEFPAAQHSARPKAHGSMFLPHWTRMFEQQDPGVTHYPVEVRYPFLDLRLVDYLLAIPAFPWSYKKEILRRSMVGRMPEELRVRPKTPLAVDPVAKKLKGSGMAWKKMWTWEGQICEFVDPPAVQILCDNIEPEDLRAYSLNVWLNGRA